MRNNRKVIAGVLAAVFITSVSSMYMDAYAEGTTQKLDGTAGIAFVAGNTVLEPGPDAALPDIKSADIHFGSRELNLDTTTYSSKEEAIEADLQYAGFIVSAANDEGWSVMAQITGFKMNGASTMAGFALELIPDEVLTTGSGEGAVAEAKTVVLYGTDSSTRAGDGDIIFSAPDGSGPAKWGCNWEGNLTVIGGSVTEAGAASATMLWTLVTGEVQI